MQTALLKWQKRWYMGYLSRVMTTLTNVTAPMLLFKPKGDRVVVHDSRSGRLIEHEIGDRGRELLTILTKPCSLEQLGQAMSPVSLDEVRKEVGALQRLGLLFEEDGRFMSLVIGEPVSWSGMPIRQFLLCLRTEGVAVRVEEGKLRYRAQQGVVTDDIRVELGKRKGQMIELLAEDTHGLQAWLRQKIVTGFEISELLEGETFAALVRTEANIIGFAATNAKP